MANKIIDKRSDVPNYTGDDMINYRKDHKRARYGYGLILLAMLLAVATIFYKWIGVASLLFGLTGCIMIWRAITREAKRRVGFFMKEFCMRTAKDLISPQRKSALPVDTTNSEKILCAAIDYKGTIVCGYRHEDCYAILQKLINNDNIFATSLCGRDKQGFLTSHNRFVDRKEAYRIAKENNQIIFGAEATDDILISENLY